MNKILNLIDLNRAKKKIKKILNNKLERKYRKSYKTLILYCVIIENLTRMWKIIRLLYGNNKTIFTKA
jgi:hypothetical protein